MVWINIIIIGILCFISSKIANKKEDKTLKIISVILFVLCILNLIYSQCNVTAEEYVRHPDKYKIDTINYIQNSDVMVIKVNKKYDY